MYNIVNNVKYRVVNTFTGKATKWHNDAVVALDEILNTNVSMLANGYNRPTKLESILRFVKFSRTDVSETTISYKPMYIREWEELEKYCPVTDIKRELVLGTIYTTVVKVARFLIIEDDKGRIYGLNKVKGIEYNHRYNRYMLTDWEYNKIDGAHSHRFYRLNKGTYVFRRGPVENIRCARGGGCGRRLSYKHTLVALDCDQCKEYRIKVRTRTARNSWDLERFEGEHKSWKDYKKYKRQWMKHCA